MIFTEFKSDNDNYLIVDHNSTLPQLDWVLLVNTAVQSNVVGTLAGRWYRDGIDYDVQGRITNGGNVTITSDRITIQYTDTLGFNISDEGNNDHAKDLLRLLFDCYNKKVYYSWVLDDHPNCVLHIGDRDIYSYINNQVFDGFDQGVQVYKNGVLVYVSNYNYISIGLPYNSNSYANNKTYKRKIDDLLSATGGYLTCAEQGDKVVSVSEDSLKKLRALEGGLRFSTSGTTYSLDPLIVQGAIKSIRVVQSSGDYRRLYIKDLVDYDTNTWVNTLEMVTFDDITNLVNVIRDSYDAIDLLEYYGVSEVKVNFVDDITRIIGINIDKDTILTNYRDHLYYDGKTVCVDLQPGMLLSSFDNVLSTTGYVGSSTNPEVSGVFAQQTNYLLLFIPNRWYPIAGANSKPSYCIIDSIRDGRIYGRFCVRPGSYICEKVVYKQMCSAIGKFVNDVLLSTGLTYNVDSTPYYTSEDPLFTSQIEPLIESLASGDITISEFFRHLEVLDQFFMPDVVQDGGINRLVNIVTDAIFGLKHLRVNNIPDWYRRCPTFICNFTIDYDDSIPLYNFVQHGVDFTALTSMLPADLGEMFLELFKDNTAVRLLSSGLAPFHLLFNLENVPEEILSQMEPEDIRDISAITGVSVRDYSIGQTCKLGVLHG